MVELQNPANRIRGNGRKGGNRFRVSLAPRGVSPLALAARGGPASRKTPGQAKAPHLPPIRGAGGRPGTTFMGNAFARSGAQNKNRPSERPAKCPPKEKGGGGRGGATNQHLKKCAGFTHLNFEMEFLAASYGA